MDRRRGVWHCARHRAGRSICGLGDIRQALGNRLFLERQRDPGSFAGRLDKSDRTSNNRAAESRIRSRKQIEPLTLVDPLSTLPIVETEKSPHSKMPMDPRTYERGLTCVHCGLCLPACPTYTETGHEADSPRGRIQLMLGLAEGKIEPTETVRKHLDLCLDCRGCETACPSGVIYHELIEETRARLGDSRSLPLQGRLVRWLFFNIFTRPSRLKLALLPARVLQKLGIYALLRKVGLFNLLPLQLRKMEQMLPSRGSLW